MRKKYIKIFETSFLSALVFFSSYSRSPKVVNAQNKLETNTLLACEIADEGTVLLKNDYEALPLKKTDVVYGVGTIQSDTKKIYGGFGSSEVNTDKKISYLAGMETAAKSGLIASYKVAKASDSYDDASKVIYYIHRSTREGTDNSETNYYLSNQEKSDIESLIDKYGKEKIIIVLNTGFVLDTTWLIEQDVAAIVLPYYAGERTGESLSHILTGTVCPSGKLVDTWAKDYNDYPSSNNFAENRFANYEEDIFVGYRYFSTFDPEYTKVNYEFGYGLSYSNFNMQYLSYKYDEESRKINCVVEVENTGSYKAKETIQIYMEAPQGKLGKAKRVLVAYEKTKLLKPQEKQSINLEIDLNDFASFDDEDKVFTNSYVLEQGQYNFYVGNSIKNANKTNFSISINKDIKVKEAIASLSPNELTKRLNSDGTYDYYELDNDKYLSTIPAYGSVEIQAENYTSSSHTNITAETYYIGVDRGCGLAKLNTTGKSVEYIVDVEKPGTYNIGFNMASALDSQGIDNGSIVGMFETAIDGKNQNIKPTMNSTHTLSDNLWHKYTYLNSDSYLITFEHAGKNTIKFTGIGTFFMNFDSFVIYNNKISSNGESIVLGENNLSKESYNHPNGASSSIANASGKNYEYKIYVEEANDYYLKLYASNITKASDDIANVYVTQNGTNVKIEQPMSLVRTAVNGTNTLESNYFTFEDTSSIKLSLNAGEAIIRIETKDEAICLIDKLIFDIENNSTSIYYDNTEQFKTNNIFTGETLKELITYDDVYADPKLLDDFVKQFSINDLVHLLGIDSTQNDVQTGVGGVGGKYVDEKFNIPSINAADGSVGIRYTNAEYYATWFPCITLLASTWNDEIAYRYGVAVGEEANVGGIQLWLAPALNIHRNPLCGRNFEYFSEDPYINELFGTAITKGVQSVGVGVCIKHFAVNSQETNRLFNNSIISERALREIYLKAFGNVIQKANPYSIMSSYNQVNGEYVASNFEFMTKYLIEENGFEGMSVSDWNASMSHTSLVLSGNNVKSMNPNYDELLSAYESGIITRNDLEKNAKCVLKFILNSTTNNQKIVTISSNDLDYRVTDLITSNDVTLKKEENGKIYSYIKFYSCENGEYEFTFEDSLKNIQVQIDGSTCEIKDNLMKVQLQEGLHSMKIITLEDIESYNITIKAPKNTTSNNMPSQGENENPSQGENENPSQGNDEVIVPPSNKDNNKIWIILGSIGGSILLVGGIVLIILLSKKRNKNI